MPEMKCWIKQNLLKFGCGAKTKLFAMMSSIPRRLFMRFLFGSLMIDDLILEDLYIIL